MGRLYRAAEDGQLHRLRPPARAMATVAVASYLYDNTGKLRAAWDPRISPALKTRYAYDAGGHLQTITPPGENAWTLAYATIPGDPDTAGSARSAAPAFPPAPPPPPWPTAPRCPAPAPRTRWAPPTSPHGGADLPTDATAVPPTRSPPTRQPATPARLFTTSTGMAAKSTRPTPVGSFPRASTRDGNAVRELSAANRARALATGSTTAEHAERARQVDTQRVYSADGVELLEGVGTAAPGHPGRRRPSPGPCTYHDHL